MLAQHLHDVGHSVLGVTGESTAASVFADKWAVITNSKSILRTSTRLYRLTRLQFPSGITGLAITVSSDDNALLKSWLTDFSAEATPDEPTDDIAAVVDRRVKARELVLWTIDNIAVSLAGRSAIVDGVARIGPVFTPPEYRRHGYGAAVTAAATWLSFQIGAKQVILYTDLDYPTSNKIYQDIGFIPDHDGKAIYFEPQKGNSKKISISSLLNLRVCNANL